MKLAALLIILASPLQAELRATLQTTQGNVIVALHYDKAPQAVANFITLAQGTRSHIDPFTGAVTNAPFYIGEKFFRVLNNPGFKIAQTGSGTGTNSGGPGFTFKDEFHPTLTHVPYVLSMANSGPNTNGSQIFLTGNATIPGLNNVHTIFGIITDAASRTVIDAIHAAGADGTTITGILFSRTDAAAIAFNEQAQNLPVVTQPGGFFTVSPAVSATWHLSQAISTGAIFRAFRSTTLASGAWSELSSARQHVGITPPSASPAIVSAVLDDAAAPQAFYNISVARHPDSVTPSTLANRTVTIPMGSSTLTYAFNATGAAGTTTYTTAVGTPIIGSFTTVNPGNGLPLAPSSDAHNIIFTADTPALNPRYLWIKTGCDSATNTQISGHHSTQYYDQTYGWQFFTKGPATLTR